jgi:hypothetical protein
MIPSTAELLSPAMAAHNMSLYGEVVSSLFSNSKSFIGGIQDGFSARQIKLV